uniref:Uncharacterized protein n=1 Tax=Mimiviridae sp. ChoanoV1 TaxID=2596887 RepID=A0A5B8IFV8_9VIRU|nr:hypothetical protein 1_312 [Mimiviridae sp. ChoanoV1]
MDIDCSRDALNSSNWIKETNKGDNNVIIGYFNDNFVNKWGDIQGISIHSPSNKNGSVSHYLNNSKLKDKEIGFLNIEWTTRSDGSAEVEIINNKGEIRCSDKLEKVNGDLHMITKNSSLNYVNGDKIRIRETEGMGVIFLKSIKFIDNKGYDTDIDTDSSDENTKFIDDLLYSVEDICVDVDYIDKVKIQLDKWKKNGLNIPSITIDELNKQKKTTQDKLEDCFEAILSVINYVNDSDSHLTSHKQLDLNIEKNLNLLDKYVKVIKLFDSGVYNVFHSINKLKNIEKEIIQFTDFGADLGNANQTIKQQIINLEDVIYESTENIRKIQKILKDYSNKIKKLRN